MPTHYSLHKVTVTTQGWREPGLPKATKEQQSFSLWWCSYKSTGWPHSRGPIFKKS